MKSEIGLFISLIIGLFCSITIQASSSMLYWTGVDFTGFDNVDCSLIKTNIRIKHFNKTAFSFSGTVEIKSDMTNDWQAELIFLYSSKGNNQFVKLPYKVPRDDLCNFADGAFTRYGAAKQLAETSDFPAPQQGTSLCTLYKKKIYTIKDFTYDNADNSYFGFIKYLRPGYYKSIVIFKKKNSNDSSLYALHFRLY